MIYFPRSTLVERGFSLVFALGWARKITGGQNPAPVVPLPLCRFQAARYSSKTAPADLHPRTRRG